MPISFCEQFHISNSTFEKTGAFNVILDVDTRVFIDPARLELCCAPEFSNAQNKIARYFDNIITLIRHSSVLGDMYWKRADQLLTFKEITGTCFGYSNQGTAGNGIGPKLRRDILKTAKSLITEGANDPTLFELLGVFQEDIGCDRISDLITFILRENIIKYTDRVVKEIGAPSIQIEFGKTSYSACYNPYSQEALLLLPSAILSPLPVAEDFDDINFICGENQRVRDTINQYFDLGARQKLSKKEILSLLQRSEEFRNSLISSYKKIPKKIYDFNEDPAGEYIWYATAKRYCEQFPLVYQESAVTSLSDVESITLDICTQFKKLIEVNGLWELLYDSTKKPKHERAAQLLFFGIADAYCTSNNIDLSRECNAGRGPVDFKLSRGAQEKIIVEIKLTSNNQLKHGVDIQVPIYMSQESVKKAIYLIIDNGHPKAVENYIKFYNSLGVSEKIHCFIIDGTPKESASTAVSV